MKCVVAGGRDYSLKQSDKDYLAGLGITELVSGACPTGLAQLGWMLMPRHGLRRQAYRSSGSQLIGTHMVERLDLSGTGRWLSMPTALYSIQAAVGLPQCVLRRLELVSGS